MLPAQLRQRFEATRILGQGGFGKVVQATDVELGRGVAIKLLHAQLSNAEMVARFQREAKVTARVQHQHIVRIFDYGVLDGGAPFIVYELIEGPDLQTLLDEGVEFGPDRLADLGIKIATGLHSAHEVGIVHRDVKPANVVLRGPGDPVLVDFGISKPTGTGEKLTAEGTILGTPAFMAPEIWSGKEASPASDQFAWAASIVGLAGGGSVYGSEEIREIIETLERSRPARICPAVRTSLGSLAPALDRALSAVPRDRFESMLALGQALHRPPPAEAPGTTRRASPKPVGAVDLARTVAPGFSPETASGTPEPSPRSRLRFRLLAAAAAIVCLLSAATLRPRPMPPDAPFIPSATPGASDSGAMQAASARVEDILEKMNKAIPGGIQPLGRLPTDETLQPIYPVVIHPRFDWWWDRLMESLLNLLMAASDRNVVGSAEFVRRLRRIVVPVGQVAQYYRTFLERTRDNSLLNSFNSQRVFRPPPVDWNLESTQRSFDAAKGAAERLLCTLDAVGPDGPTTLVQLGAALASPFRIYGEGEAQADEDGCPALVRERLGRYVSVLQREGLESGTLEEFEAWASPLMLTLESINGRGLSTLMSYSDRFGLLTELHGRFDELRTDKADPRSVRLAGLLMVEYLRLTFYSAELQEQVIPQAHRAKSVLVDHLHADRRGFEAIVHQLANVGYMSGPGDRGRLREFREELAAFR